MAKFELTKTVEGVRVNKRSGIQTGERVNLSFGAIIENPWEDRDNLRFLHMGDLYDVKLSEIEGYYKPIGGLDDTPPPKPAATPSPTAKAAAPSTGGKQLKFESLSSNLTASRAKVPGGWLVVVGHGLTFLPDANHAWDGASI